MHRNNSRAAERPIIFQKPESRLKYPPEISGGTRKLTYADSRGQADLAHWSSHGYLAKGTDNVDTLDGSGKIFVFTL